MSNTIKGTVATTKTIKGSVYGIYGKDGLSAYEVAVKNGFEGTEAEWLKSLQGSSGVYLGSGEMPEDCNVQIDPTGEPYDMNTYMVGTLGIINEILATLVEVEQNEITV